MMCNFAAVTAFTKHEEGGYTADPRDSGNWSSGIVGKGTLIGSNMGVGAPALISWLHPHPVTAGMMRTLAPHVYGSLAEARYWTPMGCTLLQPGLDLMVFDYGWNRGQRSSVLALQRVLAVAQDGKVGTETWTAINRIGASVVLHDLAEEQECEYRSLHNFDVYGDGWLARTDRRLEAAVAIYAASIKEAANS